MKGMEVIGVTGVVGVIRVKLKKETSGLKAGLVTHSAVVAASMPHHGMRQRALIVDGCLIGFLEIGAVLFHRVLVVLVFDEVGDAGSQSAVVGIICMAIAIIKS